MVDINGTHSTDGGLSNMVAVLEIDNVAVAAMIVLKNLDEVLIFGLVTCYLN